MRSNSCIKLLIYYIEIGFLSDKVPTNKDEFGSILFAEEFNCITELKISPEDGYLYIVSGLKGKQIKTEKY